MCQLPDAFADTPRLQAVAATLGISLGAANQAFAQYVPRDAIEADLVEQILLVRTRLNTATKRVLQPDLPPAVAARIDHTINATTRELRVLLDRLELRQNRYTGHLPQQYWRIEPIKMVGPPAEAAPDMPHPRQAERHQPAPHPTMDWPTRTAPVQPVAAERPDARDHAQDAPEPAQAAAAIVLPAPRWTDPPVQDGDALARFASMRIPPGVPAEEAWNAVAQEAESGKLNRALRRAQIRQNRAA